jgi:hypothetical protein
MSLKTGYLNVHKEEREKGMNRTEGSLGQNCKSKYSGYWGPRGIGECERCIKLIQRDHSWKIHKSREEYKHYDIGRSKVIGQTKLNCTPRHIIIVFSKVKEKGRLSRQKEKSNNP